MIVMTTTMMTMMMLNVVKMRKDGFINATMINRMKNKIETSATIMQMIITCLLDFYLLAL